MSEKNMNQIYYEPDKKAEPVEVSTIAIFTAIIVAASFVCYFFIGGVILFTPIVFFSSRELVKRAYAQGRQEEEQEEDQEGSRDDSF